MPLLLIYAAAAVGACNSALAPIDVAPSCPEQPLRGPSRWSAEPGDQTIDDFEDGDDRVARVAGRNGGWVLGVDGSSAIVTAEISSRCAGRGDWAGHLAGTGFTSWGVNWTATFIDPASGPALPYDGREYTGLSFWAAVGGGGVDPFELPVGLTTIDVAWNGGVCTTKCMDYYATTVSLSRAWRRVAISFDNLHQGGWGEPQVTMRRDQLVGFIVWPTRQFDLWIDDVRFEK
jgi:hypothetical protein